MALEANQVPEPTRDPRELDEVSRRGLAIYESRLKQLLEPAHEGEAVAIHVESEEYAVAPTIGGAMRAIRQTRPEGELVLMRIGSKPEYGLAARLLGQRPQTRRSR